MTSRALCFRAPFRVDLVEEPPPAADRGEVVVESVVSAISPGTELLIYRGDFPEGLPVDDTIPALRRPFSYPLSYGYAVVGNVVELGEGVERDWLGRRVFCFAPHRSHVVSRASQLLPVPDRLPLAAAAMLPSMETALSLVMDASPVVGERVVVFGQGVVGLLTTRLLATFLLERLVTVDRHALRREWSLRLGAERCLDAEDPERRSRLLELLDASDPRGGADLTFELSGNPEALDDAIAATGYHGRIVVGSWYGRKRTEIDLGGRFHRGRLRILSSQVSRLDPRWTGRWDKGRRLAVAWSLLARCDPERLVTHRFPLERADEAYRLLDTAPESSLQVLLEYGDQVE